MIEKLKTLLDTVPENKTQRIIFLVLSTIFTLFIPILVILSLEEIIFVTDYIFGAFHIILLIVLGILFFIFYIALIMTLITVIVKKLYSEINKITIINVIVLFGMLFLFGLYWFSSSSLESYKLEGRKIAAYVERYFNKNSKYPETIPDSFFEDIPKDSVKYEVIEERGEHLPPTYSLIFSWGNSIYSWNYNQVEEKFTRFISSD